MDNAYLRLQAAVILDAFGIVSSNRTSWDNCRKEADMKRILLFMCDYRVGWLHGERESDRYGYVRGL